MWRSALRRDKTFNELKAEAARHGVKTISLAEFETYAQSVLKEGRGFRTRWIKDANQLQVPECLLTGHGLVEVKLVSARSQAEIGNEKKSDEKNAKTERFVRGRVLDADGKPVASRKRAAKRRGT